MRLPHEGLDRNALFYPSPHSRKVNSAEDGLNKQGIEMGGLKKNNYEASARSTRCTVISSVSL